MVEEEMEKIKEELKEELEKGGENVETLKKPKRKRGRPRRMRTEIPLEEEIVGIKNIQFPTLSKGKRGGRLDKRALGDIPISATVELGRTKMALKEILDLNEGAIIQLERLAGEPLDLKISGQLIAQGEVVAVDDNYGLRITNVFLK